MTALELQSKVIRQRRYASNLISISLTDKVILDRLY